MSNTDTTPTDIPTDTDIPVFIIHYKKLTERKEYLTKTLREHGFTQVYWFDQFDRDTLTEEQLKMYVYDEEKWMSSNAVWHHYDSKPRPLTGPEVACTLTHIEIYKYIIENGIQKALILEDDVIFKQNFKEDFKATMDEITSLNDEFDMCFLNDAFGWTINNYKENCGYIGSLNKNTFIPGKHIYRMYGGRCSDSYIISNNAAKTLYDNIIPFCLPIDWAQTPIILTKDMKVYWSEPAITHQGSEDVYKSSMQRPRGSVADVADVADVVEAANTNYTNYTLSDLEELKIFQYRKFKDEVSDSTYSYLEKYVKERLMEFEDNIKTYRPSGLPEIEDYKNFILVKFGDGEMRNMTSTNENDHNCDNCFYYKGLGLELIKSYIYFLKNKNAYISKWHSHTYTIQKEIEKDYAEYINSSDGNDGNVSKFVYYDIIVHKLEYKDKEDNERLTFRPEKVSFFKTIKESKRFKIYISNMDMINAVAPILNLQYGIAIPATNSYLQKDEILKTMYENLEQLKVKLGFPVVKDLIFLFSGGMFAKVLIAEISKKYPQNTFIDIGSTFDGLIKYSRDFNGTVEYRDELLKYYKY